MRILLDENFPIQLYRRLQEQGHSAEHIIALGLRGLPDVEIRRRLAAAPGRLVLAGPLFAGVALVRWDVLQGWRGAR